MQLLTRSLVLGLFAASGCTLPEQQPAPSHASETPPPAGATCVSTLDCGPNDVCMEQRCRHTKTSAAGEILAAGAASQEQQHQYAAAVRGYGAAIEAFRKQGAPVPSALVCALASTSLHGATTREARELAAQQADQCLRASTPGLPERVSVVQALAELRAEGLDPAAFDAERPAAVFFTAEPEKPRVESVEIEIDLPERDSPGYADLTAGLRAPAVRDAVSRCFIADWEKQRHTRAEVSFGLKFTTRLRDMGDYDAFEPSLEITPKPAAEPSPGDFSDCVTRGVQAALSPGPKLNRVVAWEAPLRIVAHL